MMGGPVVLHHPWVVDRNIVRTLIEIGYRIAASFHQRRYQVIGFCDCPSRGIDKTRLHGLPLCRKTLAFQRVKVANVELFNAILAIRQFRFCFSF